MSGAEGASKLLRQVRPATGALRLVKRTGGLASRADSSLLRSLFGFSASRPPFLSFLFNLRLLLFNLPFHFVFRELVTAVLTNLGFKLDVFGTIGAFFLVLRGLGSYLRRQ